MPFFDPVPVPPEQEQNRSPLRWLAWFAIPLATGLAFLGLEGGKAGGLNDDGVGLFIIIGLLAGAACILFSRPRQRGFKWTFLILYPFAMFPIIGVIEFVIDGMRLF